MANHHLYKIWARAFIKRHGTYPFNFKLWFPTTESAQFFFLAPCVSPLRGKWAGINAHRKKSSFFQFFGKFFHKNARACADVHMSMWSENMECTIDTHGAMKKNLSRFGGRKPQFEVSGAHLFQPTFFRCAFIPAHFPRRGDTHRARKKNLS